MENVNRTIFDFRLIEKEDEKNYTKNGQKKIKKNFSEPSIINEQHLRSHNITKL